MTILKSRLDTRSDEFKGNASLMRDLVADLRAKTEEVARGGSEESRQRHLARGKLLPRDRIGALIDPGSAMLELSPADDYAHYALGRCLEKQGHAAQANGHYKLARSLRPGSKQYAARVMELD